MKKVQLILNIVLLAAVASLFVLVLGKKEKLGYADSSILLTKVSFVQEAEGELKAKIKVYEDQISAMETELNQLKAVADYDPTNKEAEQQLNTKYQEYQNTVRSAQEESAKLQNEIMTPVYEKINKLIKEWGEANNYKTIWAALPGGNILYGNEGSDITDELVKYLNEYKEK